MKFYGNEICCCSYACLNAIEEDIDVQLFEISTSAPFGVRHYRESHFDRLLTTFCDPNQGVDAAFGLWGYGIEKYQAFTPREAVDIIKHNIHRGRLILGPIDMGDLDYQVMPSLLQRMDHYITLEYLSEKMVLCFDSEGFYGYPLDYARLEKCIAVDHIIEAKNVITIRLPRKENIHSIRQILSVSFEKALTNLQKAEQNGQGSQAFIDCWDYIDAYEMYQWKLSLMYDIEYLLQRKHLFCVLLEQCRQYKISCANNSEGIKRILKEQIELLGRIYIGLQMGRKNKEYFERLSEYESMLVELNV